MIEDLMRSRRSVRRFLPDPVPREEIEAVLAAAVTAPSAGNKQPWRFLVVTDRALLREAAAAVREESARLAAGLDERARAGFLDYARWFPVFEDAPAVIVPLWRPAGLLGVLAGEALPEADRQALRVMDERNGHASASLALGQMVLAAHARGLGTVILTGALLARGRLRELLGVSPSWEILALVPIGRPAEEPPASPRRPLSQVVRFLGGCP